eukprot:1143416-Pelagomonas_calceolata.AAC.2
MGQTLCSHCMWHMDVGRADRLAGHDLHIPGQAFNHMMPLHPFKKSSTLISGELPACQAQCVPLPPCLNFNLKVFQPPGVPTNLEGAWYKPSLRGPGG